MILQGFKNLYNDKGEKKITKEYLCNIMKNTINLIRSTSDIENIQIKIKEPKSKALDYYGFNQTEIFQIINDNKYIEILNKLFWIIQISELSDTGKYLIHNKSKIILKKKKCNIETFGDVRAIHIMPAFVMIFDKVIGAFIDDYLKNILNKNQHGARKDYSTNTEKIGIYYKVFKEQYDKAILIDLKKAFDIVDRKILKNIMEKKIENNLIKNVALNIADIYDTININIDGNDIYSTRGIPQGSGHGPVFFCLYIDELLNNTNKIKEVHRQALIDDLIILSNNKLMLKNTFENIIKELKDIKKELNIKKCEYLSSIENDELIVNDYRL